MKRRRSNDIKFIKRKNRGERKSKWRERRAKRMMYPKPKLKTIMPEED